MTLDQFFTQPSEDSGDESTAPPPPGASTTEPPIEVTADEGSRLADLHAAYPAAKAAADEAADRLKEITDGIKSELGALGPDGATKLQLQPSDQARAAGVVPLVLTYAVSQRFDSKSFKEQHPEAYKAFTVPSGSWRLAPARGQKAGA